jgi:tyrosine-protein phosphatase OCA6
MPPLVEALVHNVIPPFRFAQVQECLFRGAYPTLKTFRFLRR